MTVVTEKLSSPRHAREGPRYMRAETKTAKHLFVVSLNSLGSSLPTENGPANERRRRMPCADHRRETLVSPPNQLLHVVDLQFANGR